MLNLIRKAFQKPLPTQWEIFSAHAPICPTCGHEAFEFLPNEDGHSEEFSCDLCETWFKATAHVSWTFTSEPVKGE